VTFHYLEQTSRVGQNRLYTPQLTDYFGDFPAINGVHTVHICRVGQNRIYTYIYTVYLVIFKPKILYVRRIYMVLANPTYMVPASPTNEACIGQ
jgi:hypothetical protein